MSRLRTLVLVLLTLLLPLRGLMAATMPCADMAPLAPASVSTAHATMAVDAASAAPTRLATAAGDTLPSPCHDDTSDDGGDAAPGTCHACASSCCMASMIGTSAVLPAPLSLLESAFPALSPRVVAVPPRGLDRPPRTS